MPVAQRGSMISVTQPLLHPQPQRIYNPITEMGFSAMFTSQLQIILRGKHCRRLITIITIMGVEDTLGPCPITTQYFHPPPLPQSDFQTFRQQCTPLQLRQLLKCEKIFFEKNTRETSNSLIETLMLLHTNDFLKFFRSSMNDFQSICVISTHWDFGPKFLLNSTILALLARC